MTKRRMPLPLAEQRALNFAHTYFPGLAINRDLFIAGSIRRCRTTVGDIELLIPTDADCAALASEAESAGDADGFFIGAPWQRVRWGPKHKCVEHTVEGYRVDLFAYVPDNFGSVLLIRTGPAEFSQRWVTALRVHGLRHRKGFVQRGDGSGEILPTPTERDAFELAAWQWIEPEKRRG